MTHLRFFVDVDRFSEGDCVVLEEKEFHHARDVIRIGPHERIMLINGRGWTACGVVEKVDRHQCVVRIQSSMSASPPPLRVVLGISLLRPSHLDFAIEKGTELGVDRFVLFPAHKSDIRRVSLATERRLHAIAIAATKQSGRLFLPEIISASSLRAALDLLPSPRFWGDLDEKASSLAESLTNLPDASSSSILIGPESGWSNEEKHALCSEGQPVRLHHLVLRAETAAIVAAYAASTR